ncbi:MAG: hypothetical protein M1816_003001 [Peltula sp. TS41687]|nr:MAG: hypothetical protein M1816_003001 [Peltula sp. TS41687]
MPRAEEIIISRDDLRPGAVQGRLSDIFHRIALNQGRTLLLGHYAGHGVTNSLWTPEEQGGLHGTDVGLILDSCYSGLATRALEKTKRSVEIIAAVDADEQALGNIPSDRSATCDLRRLATTGFRGTNSASATLAYRIPVLVPPGPPHSRGPSLRHRQAASESSASVSAPDAFQVATSSTGPSSESGF